MRQNKLFLVCLCLFILPLPAYTQCICDFSKVASTTLPAVVTIISPTPPPASQQYNIPWLKEKETIGAGFIIDPAGLIVTSYHTIKNSDHFFVGLWDGRKIKGEVKAVDPSTDVALVYIETPTPLPTVTWSDDKNLKIGESVLVAGNPFGLGASVSTGVISALGRELSDPEIGLNPAHQIPGFIQTDAAISLGHSGGPMLNSQGKVIGMITVIVSPSAGSIGLGFATPACVVKNIVSLLGKYGSIPRIELGIDLEDPDLDPVPATTTSLRLERPQRGAKVTRVSKTGLGAVSGLQEGDIILKIDAHPIDSPSDVPYRLTSLCDKEIITFVVWRDGSIHHLPMNLGPAESRQPLSKNEALVT